MLRYQEGQGWVVGEGVAHQYEGTYVPVHLYQSQGVQKELNERLSGCGWSVWSVTYDGNNSDRTVELYQVFEKPKRANHNNEDTGILTEQRCGSPLAKDQKKRQSFLAYPLVSTSAHHEWLRWP